MNLVLSRVNNDPMHENSRMHCTDAREQLVQHAVLGTSLSPPVVAPPLRPTV
jgi:hypothetical protein